MVDERGGDEVVSAGATADDHGGPAQLAVLRAVMIAGHGRSTPATLAKAFLVDEATISLTVRGLIAERLLAECDRRGDRARETSYRLTLKGTAVLLGSAM
jgi:DNA-binding MarR family transcriptional regulator